MMKRNWIAIGLAVVFGLAATVRAQNDGPPDADAVAVVRQPTLRKIHPEKDAAVVARVEFNRARLPEQYRRRNNFAWAVAKVKGLDKTEYFAHSGIQDLDSLSAEAARAIAGISLRPPQGRFHALCVNQNDVVDGHDCWVRAVDTEYKILEDLAARLPDPSVKGRVKLYTDLPPCASCWNVMKQFLAAYTNIQMQVLYGKK